MIDVLFEPPPLVLEALQLLGEVCIEQVIIHYRVIAFRAELGEATDQEVIQLGLAESERIVELLIDLLLNFYLCGFGVRLVLFLFSSRCLLWIAILARLHEQLHLALNRGAIHHL